VNRREPATPLFDADAEEAETADEPRPADEEAGGADTDKADAPESIGPYYDEAVELVLKKRRASEALLQRRLPWHPTFVEARMLLDQMAVDGIVGPMGDGGGREVLLTPEAWKSRTAKAASPQSEASSVAG
jgi:DNA segregation ATPase FtsK/SpoIIIE-like protein